MAAARRVRSDRIERGAHDPPQCLSRNSWMIHHGGRIVSMLAGDLYAISKPRIVPVDEANFASSSPMRWSIETKRFGSG